MKKTIYWLMAMFLCCNLLAACSQKDAETVVIQTESVEASAQTLSTVSTEATIETKKETANETYSQSPAEISNSEVIVAESVETLETIAPTVEFEADLSNITDEF